MDKFSFSYSTIQQTVKAVRLYKNRIKAQIKVLNEYIQIFIKLNIKKIK